MVNNCHPLVLNEIDVADHGVPFGLIVAYRIIGVTGVREMYVTQYLQYLLIDCTMPIHLAICVLVCFNMCPIYLKRHFSID